MPTKNPHKPVTRSKPSRRGLRSRRIAVQKPHGELTPRVRLVGPEKFALVCCDPAKHRTEWLMADFYGALLVPPQTVEHNRGQLDAAVASVRRAIEQHQIGDVIVCVERTGNFHMPVKRAFAAAGFETRIVHPFAVKQYRLPADPGNKTDHTDLFAQHRAVISGFGLTEPVLDEIHRTLRILIRHRRELVRKNSALCCQIKEHLQLAMPGYAALFQNLWSHASALILARCTGTPQAVLAAGSVKLAAELRERKIACQPQTLDKVLAWAREAPAPDPDAILFQRVWTDLDDLRTAQELRIVRLETDIAARLVRTPYVLLMAIPGVNVVSAADLAGEMGPIENYANANAITGRAGLYPARYQSDTTDHADGPLIRQANRRLRGALMQIADNLSRLNGFFRGRAEVLRQKQVDERALKVKIAKGLSRLIYASVAGRQILKHPCCADRDSILDKLRRFHLDHQTDPRQLLADLDAAVSQLPADAYDHEHQTLAEILAHKTRRTAGPQLLADLLPDILARLRPRTDPPKSLGDTALN